MSDSLKIKALALAALEYGCGVFLDPDKGSWAVQWKSGTVSYGNWSTPTQALAAAAESTYVAPDSLVMGLTNDVGHLRKQLAEKERQLRDIEQGLAKVRRIAGTPTDGNQGEGR